MPAGNINRVPWRQEADFKSHGHNFSPENLDTYEPTLYADYIKTVLLSDDPEIAAYTGYPEVQLDIAIRSAQDLFHKDAVERARQQRESSGSIGKVLVLRTVFEPGETQPMQTSRVLPRRRSLG